MECDDLGHPVCQYIWDAPRIKPEEVHIVVWTRSTPVSRGKKGKRSSPPSCRATATTTTPTSPPAGTRRRSERLRANRTTAASSGTGLSANDFSDASSLNDTDEDVSPTSDTTWSARGSQKPRRQQRRRIESDSEGTVSREPSPRPSRDRSPPSQPLRHQHERLERPQKGDSSDLDPSILRPVDESQVRSNGTSDEVEQLERRDGKTLRSAAIGSAAAAVGRLDTSAATPVATSTPLAKSTTAGSANEGRPLRPARPKWNAVLNQRLAPWQVAAEKLNLVQPRPITEPTTAMSWPTALQSIATGASATPAAPTTYYDLVKPLLGKRIACVAKANTYAAYDPKPTAAKRNRWSNAVLNEQSMPKPAPPLPVPPAIPSETSCYSQSSTSATSPTRPLIAPLATPHQTVPVLPVDMSDHCATPVTCTSAAAACPTTVTDQWNLGLLDDLEF